MTIIRVTDDEFEDSLSNHENVIVKYYADWCGSCKLFSPKFKKLSEDEQYKGISFLEVNAEENELARRRGGVNNLPFFATFNKGELIEGTATTKVETVIEMLEKLE